MTSRVSLGEGLSSSLRRNRRRSVNTRINIELGLLVRYGGFQLIYVLIKLVQFPRLPPLFFCVAPSITGLIRRVLRQFLIRRGIGEIGSGSAAAIGRHLSRRSSILLFPCNLIHGVFQLSQL